MQDAKEEVRARLNIEDVIGEYVQLKRAGRNFKGLSPFSGEKTPSFVVSPDKHIWHDFSSGKGGDVFSFVMEVEGLDFRQALEQLARRAGVDLTQYQSKQSGEIAKKKKRLLQAHDLAANYYQQSLVKNQHALEYVFKHRKLSKEVVQSFRIGYSPTQGEALVQFLTRKGFTKAELADAGLVNRFGGDLFRGRMMVPLMDGAGQVIGFTARIIGEADAKAPKYLNTPQTLLYDKSRHVFGLSQAKEAIRTSDQAVVVEGNLDVVSSHQVNVQKVVATAGTALTEHHIRALSRLSGNICLAFDGDKAGIAATERSIPIAQSVGVELSILTLPGDAKDPDELIQQDPELWEQAIRNAQPALDWILEQYLRREDIATAAGKRAYTSAGLTLLRQIPDAVVRDHYLQNMVAATGASLEVLREKLSTIDLPQETAPTKRVMASAATKEQATEDVAYQDSALSALLVDVAARDVLREMDQSLFAGEARQAIAKYLVGSQEVPSDTPVELQKYDTYVKILLLKADTRYASWNDTDRYFEIARLLRQIATEHKKQQKEHLTQQLREAETNGDDALADSIRAQLYTLIKEIKNG